MKSMVPTHLSRRKVSTLNVAAVDDDRHARVAVLPARLADDIPHVAHTREHESTIGRYHEVFEVGRRMSKFDDLNSGPRGRIQEEEDVDGDADDHAHFQPDQEAGEERGRCWDEIYF